MAITFMNVSQKNAQINEFSAFSSQHFCTAGFLKLKLEDSRYFHVFAIINGNILRVITLSFSLQSQCPFKNNLHTKRYRDKN